MERGETDGLDDAVQHLVVHQHIDARTVAALFFSVHGYGGIVRRAVQRHIVPAPGKRVFQRAGAGLLVLFKMNKDKRENLKILSLLYVIGVLAGMILELFA